MCYNLEHVSENFINNKSPLIFLDTNKNSREKKNSNNTNSFPGKEELILLIHRCLDPMRFPKCGKCNHKTCIRKYSVHTKRVKIQSKHKP